MAQKQPEITFKRLPTVPLSTLIEHMNNPRVATHMPLLDGPWDETAAQDFITTKEACWRQDGLGHWAIYVDGTYSGWGGFQKEGDDWDYGLVLTPGAFGQGLAITLRALDFARKDNRIPHVTFLLPPSRKHLGALKRLGAEFTGFKQLQGQKFLEFRLATSAP